METTFQFFNWTTAYANGPPHPSTKSPERPSFLKASRINFLSSELRTKIVLSIMIGLFGVPRWTGPQNSTCPHFSAACHEPVIERSSCQHLLQPKTRKCWALRIKSAMGTTFFHHSHSTHLDQAYGPSHLTCISLRSQLFSFRLLSLRLQSSDVAKNLMPPPSQLLSPTQPLPYLPPPQLQSNLCQLQSNLLQHQSSLPQHQLSL